MALHYYVKGRETISKTAAVVDQAYSAQLQEICSGSAPESFAAQRFKALQLSLKLHNLLQKSLFSSNEVLSDFQISPKSYESKTKAAQIFRFKRFSWSCWADLNRRPHPYQGCALPTELQQQIWRPGTGSNRRPLA